MLLRGARRVCPIYNFIDNVLLIGGAKAVPSFCAHERREVGVIRPAMNELQRKRCRLMNNSSRAWDSLSPVYNEGTNMLPTLRALSHNVKTPDRILIFREAR